MVLQVIDEVPGLHSGRSPHHLMRVGLLVAKCSRMWPPPLGNHHGWQAAETTKGSQYVVDSEEFTGRRASLQGKLTYLIVGP